MFDKDKECDGCLQKILVNSTDGIIIIDEDGTVVLYNISAETIFKVKENEILGKKLDVLFDLKMAEKHSLAVKDYFAGRGKDMIGKTLVLNTRNKRDEDITIALSLSEVCHRGKRMVMADIRDVTEEANYQALLEGIYNNIATGIIVYDSNLCYKAWNKFMEEYTGYQCEELIGKVCYEVFPFLLNSGIVDLIKKVLNGETVRVSRVDFNIPEKGKSGSFQAVYTPYIRNNQIRGVIGLVTDISSNLLREKEKEKLEQKLRQAQKMEALGTFAGGIAHNFNNILSVIIGYAELSIQDMENVVGFKQIKDNLNNIVQSSLRGAELIKKIMTYSRQTLVNKEIFCLSRLLQQLILLTEKTIRQDVMIKSDIVGDIFVEGDKTGMETSIMNLINNAEKAMPNGGLMKIALSVKEKSSIEMVIEDSGVGITEEIIPRIFDVFFTTKPVGEGTGLGLWTVYDVIHNKFRGFIDVESKVGAGTKFIITLPMAEMICDKSELKIDFKRYSGQALVIDDEESLVKIGMGHLKNMGFSVKGFHSSLAALEYFKQNSSDINLVITDYSMPLKNGKFLAREMLAIKPSIPIVICSGYQEEAEEFMNIGVRAILSKPYSKNDLREIVKKIM